MKTITISIVITILSLGFIADANAADIACTDEKAKSFGFPLVPIGTVVMCETEESVGFD